MNPIACIRYALCLLAAFACFGLGTAAHAQTTFTVNVTTDESDTNPGDGVCDVGVVAQGLNPVGCSLRGAIEEANAYAGSDTVDFTIVTATNADCGSVPNGICVIEPDSLLPAITDTLYIDGETQGNATCGTGFSSRDLRIVLDGSSAGTGSGLEINGGHGSVVRGLVINHFDGYGINVVGTADVHVACNFIGTSQSGASDQGNVSGGIGMGDPGANGTIVGTNGDGIDDEAEGNLISGNGGPGVRSQTVTAGTIVAGNFIGVAADGVTVLGNDGEGVFQYGDDATIGTNGDGTSDELEFNVIAANGGVGINIGGGAATKVSGNFIGTDTTGTLDLGNGDAGIYSYDSDGTTIGYDSGTPATRETERNVIAFNTGIGVMIDDGGWQTAIRGNEIYSNGSLGIDLAGDGPTPNDAGDPDSGENDLQNFPDIVSAILSGTNLVISYNVDSDNSNSAYPLDVEFFMADADQEEGKRFVGSTTYTSSDWNGCGASPCVEFVVFTSDLAAGDSVLATATDASGNTSEFSAAVEIATPSLVVNATSDAPDILPGDGICDNGAPVDLVNCSLRAAIEEANAFAGPDTITFAIVPALPPTFCDEGTGICGILPDSTLPVITDTVAILGETQPSSVCGTIGGRSLKLVLRGTNAGSSAIGLELSGGASGSRVSGINIQDFDSHGIELDGADGVHIACNNIGTDVAGTSAAANGGSGVNLTNSADGNTIGMNSDGTLDVFEWNVISGNGGNGVTIGSSDNNVLALNAIGIGADGTTAIGNDNLGIQITAGAGNRIGTDGDGLYDGFEGNVITANGSHGVLLVAPSSLNNWIAGNFIGTNPALASGLGNTGDGVRFNGEASQGTVGSNLDGSSADLAGTMANVIAYNGGAGVALVDATIERVAIHGNSIYSNVGLGIDLNIDGPTGNDAGDPDVGGANSLQNYPDLSAVYVDPDDLTITYTVDSDTANSAYPLVVEFYQADADQEEGMAFVRRDTFTVADWSGCGTPPCNKTAFLTNEELVAGDTLVATATDSLGNTSEFSVPIEAVEPPPPPEGIALHVKAFLEGPFVAGMMNTDLNDQAYVPLSQPFSASKYNSTVLNYDSTQTVGALPDSTVDWVLVSLRTGTGPETEVAGSQFAALVSENGTVASTGEDSLRFIGIAGGSYYLVVRGRNHADVMSSSAIDATGGTGSWDFTTGSGQAFGSSPMKDLGDGSFGMYAGDADADGFITATDFNIWNTSTTAGDTGYQAGDFDMDGNVTATDFNKWNTNTTAGGSSGVPD